jgi:glycosyltransferase involved in cell wall biosynthesis
MSNGFTIIIPVFNEADIVETNTRSLVAYLAGLNRSFEVLLISNGSTDQTERLCAGLSRDDQRVRYYSLPKKGVGRAFAVGVTEARFDRLVSVDMDLSIDLDFIPRALDYLENISVVVGSKKKGIQHRPLWRRAGSTIFIITARLLLGLKFEDYSIAAKAYRRDVISQYLDRIDYGTFYVMDILYHALSDGFSAIEIPVWCLDRRPSKFNLPREALYRFRNLFLLWWRYHVRGPQQASRGRE